MSWSAKLVGDTAMCLKETGWNVLPELWSHLLFIPNPHLQAHTQKNCASCTSCWIRLWTMSGGGEQVAGLFASSVQRLQWEQLLRSVSLLGGSLQTLYPSSPFQE